MQLSIFDSAESDGMFIRSLGWRPVRILEGDITSERQFLLSNLGAAVNVNELGSPLLLT